MATKARSLLSAVLAVLALAAGASAQDTISAAEAAHHVGEERTVCGHVASAIHAMQSRGQPTFLNLDRPYPNHIFTVLIWGSDRPNFAKAPEAAYRDQRICVSGRIEDYKGRPQIAVREAKQIRLASPP